jgi:hypothetical protein
MAYLIVVNLMKEGLDCMDGLRSQTSFSLRVVDLPCKYASKRQCENHILKVHTRRMRG